VKVKEVKGRNVIEEMGYLPVKSLKRWVNR
jgi:hypothetical protein